MPDFRYMLLHIINIALLYALLRWLVYGPVRKFLAERKGRMDDERAELERMRAEAAEVTTQSQAILNAAREESNRIINEGAEKAKANADDIVQKAHERSKIYLDEAREAAEHERLILEQELKTQVSELAMQIAAKVLKREVRPEDNDAVIDEFFGVGP